MDSYWLFFSRISISSASGNYSYLFNERILQRSIHYNCRYVQLLSEL